MQINVKDGKKVIKPTQAELRALENASEVAHSAKIIGVEEGQEVISAIESLVAALGNESVKPATTSEAGQ